MTRGVRAVLYLTRLMCLEIWVETQSLRACVCVQAKDRELAALQRKLLALTKSEAECAPALLPPLKASHRMYVLSIQ